MTVAGTTKTYEPADIARFSADMEGKEPQEILRWAVQEFQPGLTLACSFGGPTGMVLLDMIMGIDPSKVVYLQNSGTLGNATDQSIEQRGERIAAVRTDFALIDEFRHLRLPA